MTRTHRPVLTTIFFGLVCGLAFIPMNMGLGYIVPWSGAFCLILWSYLAVYGFLLTRWGRKRPSTIGFPLLLLFFAIFIIRSNWSFLLLALGIFSWIRSGICFQTSFWKRLGAEILLCSGGIALVACFTSYSMFTWAMGIWMFFLVQALYFVLLENVEGAEDETMVTDPFEKASMKAEKILSSDFFS